MPAQLLLKIACSVSIPVISALITIFLCAYAFAEEPLSVIDLAPKESQSIQRACTYAQRFSDPATYYGCLQREIDTLRRSPGQPDLSKFPTEESQSIEQACNNSQRFSGPAAYYGCLNEEANALIRLLGIKKAIKHDEQRALISEMQDKASTKAKRDKPESNKPAAESTAPTAPSPPLTTSPDLGNISAAEREQIEEACALDLTVDDKQMYEECLRLEAQDIVAVSEQHSQQREPRVDLADRLQSTADPQRMASPVPKTQSQQTPQSMLPPVASVTPKTSPPRSRDSSSGATAVIWAVLISLLVYGAFRKNRKKACISCGKATIDPTGKCDACQARIKTEQERVRQEAQREAARRAEEARRVAEAARAQEQRRRDQERRNNAQTLENLQRLTGEEFEQLIESLFRQDGYAVIRCGGTGDEGIDVILQLKDVKDVVQCKRWRGGIGSSVVREFYGSMMHAGTSRIYHHHR